MSELNRDQIIKAMECCTSGNSVSACMRGCPLYEKEDCECINDDTALLKYALSLIKELTEENEKQKDLLCKANAKIYELQREQEGARADTVRKMQERLKEYLDDFYNLGEDTLLDVPDLIDQIAKEMLGRK